MTKTNYMMTAEEVAEEIVIADIETAPQTFDAGTIAAVAALVSVAGFVLSRKR